MKLKKFNHDTFHFISKLKNINWFIFFIILILAFIGCATLYSVSGGIFSFLVKSHLIKFCFSLSIFFIIFFLGKNIIYNFSYFFFFFTLFLLFILIFFGTESAGSKRWLDLGLFTIQPSEISKIGLILALSRYYNDFKQVKNSSIFKIIISVLMVLLPFYLIIKQPDLGTGVLLLFIGLSIIFVSGISFTLIFFGTLLSSFAIPLIWGQLYDYQKRRILTFLNPESDPLGSGYHIAQSKIAIGSGGFFGKGYMNGSQSQLQFIPEIHTDFIFSIFSEEFGFFGSSIIILLYAFIIVYGLLQCLKTENYYNKLVIFGLTINIFLYFIVNISMVIGLLPVVGVPLPLVSFGGSAMLAAMISLSIIMCLKKNSNST